MTTNSLYNNNNVIKSGKADGMTMNPFARGGLARSSLRGAGVPTSDHVAEGSTGGARGGAAPAEEAQVTSADLTRALNRNRGGLPKMLVVAEQLNELIGYMNGRTTISKDLKQGLLKLRKSLTMTKKGYV